jgi:hypothetical protein
VPEPHDGRVVRDHEESVAEEARRPEPELQRHPVEERVQEPEGRLRGVLVGAAAAAAASAAVVGVQVSAVKVIGGGVRRLDRQRQAEARRRRRRSAARGRAGDDGGGREQRIASGGCRLTGVVKG